MMIETAFRDWQCSCGHSFTAQVVFSEETTNLSGEATAWCPKCNGRPHQGSRPYLKIPVGYLDRLEGDPLDRAALDSLVTCGLRQTIEVHGPITMGLMASAVKRINGPLIAVFKNHGKEAITESAKALVTQDQQRLEAKIRRLEKTIRYLLEVCKDAGILPLKENHERKV